MRTYALLLVGSCLAGLASAAPLLVDDFSSLTPQSVTQWGVGQSSAWMSGGAMLGGSRGLTAAVTTSSFGFQSTIQIVPGIGAVSDNAGNAGFFGFSYFGTSTDGVSVQYGYGTNADLSAYNEIQVDMISSDKPFTLRANFYADGSIERWQKSFGAIGSPTTISISSADWLSGSIDHANTDAVAIWFITEIDGDLSLREIRMAPEPAGLAVLGLGLAAMRRRKKA